MFGYVLNAHYCLWDPWTSVVKPQDNQKQLEVAFLCWVANCVYKHIKQRREIRRTKTEHNKAQWRSALSAHHRPPSFPRQPLLFLFSFSFYILYCSRCMWIVESSSPPASVVSTASHCSSSSPSPLSSAFSTVHVACEQWRAAHHQPPSFPPPATALPLLLSPSPSLILLFHLLHSSLSSFAFSTVHVNSGEYLHYSWPDRVRPKPKCSVSGSDLIK